MKMTTANKVAKAKTSKAAAPVVAQVAPTKIAIIRLTEADKAADPVNFIKNPTTNKHVKRDTVFGKKLVLAEKEGTEVEKPITETERLILVVKTLQEACSLTDDNIKDAMDKISDNLPRGFPNVWGGKHKEPRHADHPKGACNAYIYYTKAVRESTVAANPELNNTDIVSLMAKMWKDTPVDARGEYESLAAADKQRYEEEMKVFEAKHPDQARASTKSASTPEKPSKATAYLMFCRDNREQAKADNAELDGKAITKLLAEQWAEVKKDESELAKYQALASEANEDLDERRSDYNSSPVAAGKKLSASEQAKADDPENYEMGEKGRYVKKTTKKAEKAASPQTPTNKKTKKSVPSAPKRSKAKEAKEAVKEEEKDEDDDLLIA